MFAFDLRTSFLILGLFYLLLPAITWAVLAGHRTTQVALWCGGGLMIGAAAILSSLVDQLPTVVSIGLAGLLFLIAVVARIQSLLLDIGRPWRLLRIVAGVLAIYLLLLGLHYGAGNPILRAQAFSIVMAAMMAYLSMLAWRIGRNEISNSALWICWAYALVSMALLVRLFNLEGVGPTALAREGYSAQLIVVSLLLSSVTGHLGYIGLQLDRSVRRELMAEAERVRNEERHHLGEQIAQLDRSRALGEMAASLGHELNQPLTATLTNAQVAKRGLQGGRFDSNQLADFFDKIIHNTQRASQIIERIRGFIRPSQVSSAPVNLNLVVHEVNELVAGETGNRQVSVKFNPHPLPLLVTGDSIQLSQVILNVVRNAIEALSQVARREILITSERVDDRAILRIRDSGPGLTAEVLQQIGTPFFTTKLTGLGLGFSISRSITNQHGGTLTIANADGGGVVVELTLPALMLPTS